MWKKCQLWFRFDESSRLPKGYRGLISGQKYQGLIATDVSEEFFVPSFLNEKRESDHRSKSSEKSDIIDTF